MTLEMVRGTALWRTGFTSSGVAIEDDARSRLQAELLRFRERAHALVSHIHISLPDLTLHDASHLDALWRVGSLIAGDHFPINPLETFVLGGAFLLHDAALCIEAYEGGLQGIRSTSVWRDTFAIEKDRNPGSPLAETEHFADFVSMRALHAARASELALYGWSNPTTNGKIHLIEDLALREHVGKLIGEIASSHHWSIDEVRDRLGTQLNPPSGYPSDWVIDATKVACLLRTADAAHFSQDRAPDFLHALKRRRGVSGAHWNAQNRITGPAAWNLDPNGETIVYTSTKDFSEAEADAWWVAYDALIMIQREISGANELLASRNLANGFQLKVKRVAGTNSVSQLAQFIRASGWEPCGVNIHISDVESLVRNLGGEKLYGANTSEQKHYVVLRELIQNSRDAIVALRSIENDYDGEITIRLIDEGSDQWLQIEDDGVGMSRRVLTGSLLDFGSSFWSSDLIKQEFPGLKAKGYRSIGRFGIGFYSIFMIGAHVSVSSRRWNAGQADTVQIIFPDGLSMRPIVKQGSPHWHDRHKSTVIRMKLLDACKIINPDAIKLQSGYVGMQQFYATFQQIIASWITALEVPVKFARNNDKPTTIHIGSDKLDAVSLLRQISISASRESVVDQNIAAIASRMRPIGNRALGFAALQDSPSLAFNATGMRTVGGFGQNSIAGDQSFAGYIDCEPDSARRGPEKFSAGKELISAWAQEQIILFEASNPSDIQRAYIGYSISSFSIDPISVARVLVLEETGHSFVSINYLAQQAEDKTIIFPEFSMGSAIDSSAELHVVPNAIIVQGISNGPFSDLTMEDGAPKNPFSILGCLSRAVEDIGLRLVAKPCNTTFRSLFGQQAKASAFVAVKPN